MTADDLTLGHGLADTADAISMRYFSEHRFRAETKPDGSPVAEADRLVEAAVRAQLARLRPGDAFVRHHHRCKQAQGWRLEQITPGIMR